MTCLLPKPNPPLWTTVTAVTLSAASIEWYTKWLLAQQLEEESHSRKLIRGTCGVSRGHILPEGRASASCRRYRTQPHADLCGTMSLATNLQRRRNITTGRNSQQCRPHWLLCGCRDAFWALATNTEHNDRPDTVNTPIQYARVLRGRHSSVWCEPSSPTHTATAASAGPAVSGWMHYHPWLYKCSA